jgi:TonB family protein
MRPRRSLVVMLLWASVPAAFSCGQARAEPTVNAACGVYVKDIIALDGVAYGKATTYAVYLASFDGVASPSAGTVALFAGNDRYDVSFDHVVAGGDRYATEATPLVVRFPAPLRIDAASLARLGTDPAPPCAPVRTDATWLYGASAKRSAALDALFARASSVPPLTAPSPVHGPAAPPCAVSYRPPSAKTLAAPNTTVPAVQVGFREGIYPATVTVEVTIADDGTVLRARVLRSSDFAPYDAAALDAARRSVFEPEVRDCRSRGGTYAFEVTFVPPSR